jgi:protein TonB
VDVVLSVQRPERQLPVAIALVVAVGLCVVCVVGLWLLRSARGADPHHAIASRAPDELAFDLDVDLLEPPPAAKVLEPVATAPLQRRPAAHVTTRSSTAPAAQAATVVAQEPSPSAPVDMTGETFVTGTAKTYAGGVTERTGTNTRPGHGSDAPPTPAAAAGVTSLDRSTAVALANQSWSCPWPNEADALQIDEQVVVIRVVVRSDGTAESVAVVSDPGHGFGPAAASCALRTLFAPARTRNGDFVRATSPPIRVRFTR